MGNNSAQNTYSSWVEQDTLELGFADRELGRPVDPACGHAAPNPVRRATPLAVVGNPVREAPTRSSRPGSGWVHLLHAAFPCSRAWFSARRGLPALSV